MKKYLNIVYLAILALCFISSCKQKEPFESASLGNKILITSKPETIWNYISDLGNLQHLVPSVIKTSTANGVGLGSIVTIALNNNAGQIKEEVITFNEKERIIRYTMIETPMPIREYIGQFNVKQLDANTSEVSFLTTFKVQKSNREQRTTAFNTLQLELLNNLKELHNEK